MRTSEHNLPGTGLLDDIAGRFTFPVILASQRTDQSTHARLELQRCPQYLRKSCFDVHAHELDMMHINMCMVSIKVTMYIKSDNQDSRLLDACQECCFLLNLLSLLIFTQELTRHGCSTRTVYQSRVLTARCRHKLQQSRSACCIHHLSHMSSST